MAFICFDDGGVLAEMVCGVMPVGWWQRGVATYDGWPGMEGSGGGIGGWRKRDEVIDLGFLLRKGI